MAQFIIVGLIYLFTEPLVCLYKTGHEKRGNEIFIMINLIAGGEKYGMVKTIK